MKTDVDIAPSILLLDKSVRENLDKFDRTIAEKNREVHSISERIDEANEEIAENYRALCREIEDAKASGAVGNAAPSKKEKTPLSSAKGGASKSPRATPLSGDFSRTQRVTIDKMIDEKLKKFRPSALASAEPTPKLSSMPKNKTVTPESMQQ